MKYFPDLQPQVPPVELVPLTPKEGKVQAEAAHHSRPRRQSKQTGQTGSIDIRSPILNEFLESGNLEPNSRRAYSRALQRFLTWSPLPFAEVTPRQITQYRDWLEHTPNHRTGKPLARSSVNLEVAALKVFFGWLHQHYPHHCPANPTVQVKQKKLSTPPPNDLSTAALDWIWQTLPLLGQTVQRDTLLVHLLAHGLRASEIETLNLASFDGEVVFLSETKTHSARMVPLSRSSLQVMGQYLEWRRVEMGMSPEPELPLVISLHVAYRGERLSYRGIYQAVERIGHKAQERCTLDWLDQVEQQHEQQVDAVPVWWSAAQTLRLAAELGVWDGEAFRLLQEQMPHAVRQAVEELSNLHPHQFRHTYATQLLLKGLDPSHARKLTGHQSQQVFKRYTQRAEQQAAIDAFRRLEEAGEGIVPS